MKKQLFLLVVIVAMFCQCSDSNSNTVSREDVSASEDNVSASEDEYYGLFYEPSYALGDLNKDGIPDSVSISYCKRRTNSYFENDTISIYFGTKENTYQLFLRAAPLSCLGEPIIRSNGTLKFRSSPDCNGYLDYIFRFQNNDFYLIGFENRCEGSEAESVNFSTKILEKEQWYVLHEYDEEYEDEDEDGIGDRGLDYTPKTYRAKYHIEFDSLIPMRVLTDTSSLYRVGEPVEKLKDTVRVKRKRY
ncbi:MAG: hypothetical protein J6Y22_00305 [Paludibacteraceae bacterium]|nr:hypothetical protein [Paludibacteraceae bacterium]